MTREEIEDMPAGREMNLAVAEHVMHWPEIGLGSPYRLYQDHGGVIVKDFSPERFRYKGDNMPPSWHPSTNIADAWHVVSWLRNHYGTFTLTASLFWHCMAEEVKPWGGGDTPEVAICRAALLTTLGAP